MDPLVVVGVAIVVVARGIGDSVNGRHSHRKSLKFTYISLVS
jgi:hypothetical protein